MWIVSLLLLVALGVLGVASWLRQKKPEVAGPLAQLEGVGGWVGLVGLVWGLISVFSVLTALSAFSAAPMLMTVALVSALVIVALSLILAMPTLKTLAGSNPFTLKLETLSTQLAGFKMMLGAVCLGLAGYSVVLRVL